MNENTIPHIIVITTMIVVGIVIFEQIYELIQIIERRIQDVQIKKQSK